MFNRYTTTLKRYGKTPYKIFLSCYFLVLACFDPKWPVLNLGAAGTPLKFQWICQFFAQLGADDFRAKAAGQKSRLGDLRSVPMPKTASISTRIRRGIPFDVCVPNVETLAALNEAEAGGGDLLVGDTQASFDAINREQTRSG